MKIDDLSPGMAVRWIHVPRGGYGFPIPVDVRVERICAKKVWVRVLLSDGRSRLRLVDPANLRPGLS